MINAKLTGSVRPLTWTDCTSLPVTKYCMCIHHMCSSKCILTGYLSSLFVTMETQGDYLFAVFMSVEEKKMTASFWQPHTIIHISQIAWYFGVDLSFKSLILIIVLFGTYNSHTICSLINLNFLSDNSQFSLKVKI